jgi:trk system potassium uptake protein TrkH
MKFSSIFRIFGLFLILYSTALLPPIALSFLYDDHEEVQFTEVFGLTLSLGLLIWWPVRRKRLDLRRREGFLIVALFWVVMSLLGALPFILNGVLGFTDAFFEAASAFTTTGATVITGLDSLPRSLLFYRSELQWLGGMGIIVLAVAILPMLGIGGMALYKAETPGPMKDDKLTPRIAHSARAFWGIYLGLTVACALGYWGAGMSAFDAVAHSFTTVSTGGFSTHDASMGYFKSPAIEAVADLFMLMGGINFSIHFLVWRSRRLGNYFRDAEVLTYFGVVLVASLIIALTLTLTGIYGGFDTSLRHSVFHVISIMTSTGFTSQDFTAWPFFLPTLLFFISFIGGCAGSTAGGMKVMRIIIIFKQGLRDIFRLMHPHIISTIKVNGRVLPQRSMDAVWGFFALYIATFAIYMLLLMATGMDQVTAFSAVATTLNNTGPGLGTVTTNFQVVGDFGKWLLASAMLLGRLEIFTLLVIFSPEFWRA